MSNYFLLDDFDTNYVVDRNLQTSLQIVDDNPKVLNHILLNNITGKCRVSNNYIAIANTGWECISFLIQMCPPTVTLFGPGKSVTEGKRHCSHAYVFTIRKAIWDLMIFHCSQNVTIGVVTVGEHICIAMYIYYKKCHFGLLISVTVATACRNSRGHCRRARL